MGVDRPADGALLQRMLSAARADPAVYAAVAADRTANLQAAVVVAVATLSQVVGDFIDTGLGEGLQTIVSYPIGWVAITVTVYLLARAVRGPRGTIDPAGFTRAMAFSQVPLSLYVLAAVPALSAIVGLVSTVWIIATVAAAVRGVVRVSWLIAVPVAFVALLLVVIGTLTFTALM